MTNERFIHELFSWISHFDPLNGSGISTSDDLFSKTFYWSNRMGHLTRAFDRGPADESDCGEKSESVRGSSSHSSLIF